jgi:enediyne biosynthesis protein E5
MEVNIVFTLFFAVAIVCGLRGTGWWTVHLYKKFRATHETTLVAAPTTDSEPARLAA